LMIKGGSSEQVSFTIKRQDLAFYRKDFTYGTEAGSFKVFVGTNSNELLMQQFELTEGTDF